MESVDIRKIMVTEEITLELGNQMRLSKEDITTTKQQQTKDIKKIPKNRYLECEKNNHLREKTATLNETVSLKDRLVY